MGGDGFHLSHPEHVAAEGDKRRPWGDSTRADLLGEKSNESGFPPSLSCVFLVGKSIVEGISRVGGEAEKIKSPCGDRESGQLTQS